MAPEVVIPSLNELVLSEAEGGQAHENRAEAPQDFECQNPLLYRLLLKNTISYWVCYFKRLDSSDFILNYPKLHRKTLWMDTYMDTRDLTLLTLSYPSLLLSSVVSTPFASIDAKPIDTFPLPQILSLSFYGTS